MVEIGSQSYRVMQKSVRESGLSEPSTVPNPLRAEHKVVADFETNKLTTYAFA